MTRRTKLLFVGEKKSKTAIKRGWSWHNGRLAAKQLFDALEKLAIDPASVKFANAFERGHLAIIRAHAGPVIAMGKKAQKKLGQAGIKFKPMIHPAARGRIRKKELYFNHVNATLKGLLP